VWVTRGKFKVFITRIAYVGRTASKQFGVVMNFLHDAALKKPSDRRQFGKMTGGAPVITMEAFS
jgi:hypothetical protein